MECRPSYAVLLDEEGRFWKAANRNYQVGQTVERVVLMRRPRTPRKKALIYLPVLAAAACLMLVAAVLLRTPITPYASVYLTINPQVRMDVDRQSMVQQVEGVNQDGVLLVQGYDWDDKTLDQVTDDLIDRAVEMGYLAPGGTVTIDLESEDEAWSQAANEELYQHLQEYLRYQDLSVTVQVGQNVFIPVAPPATAAPTPAPTQSPTAAPAPAAGDSGYGDDDGQAPGDSGYGETVPEQEDEPEDDPADDQDDPDDDREEAHEPPEDTAGDSGYARQPQEPPDDDDDAPDTDDGDDDGDDDTDEGSNYGG